MTDNILDMFTMNQGKLRERRNMKDKRNDYRQSKLGVFRSTAVFSWNIKMIETESMESRHAASVNKRGIERSFGLCSIAEQNHL